MSLITQKLSNIHWITNREIFLEDRLIEQQIWTCEHEKQMNSQHYICYMTIHYYPMYSTV